MNGFWQTINTADWNLEAQGGGPAPKEGLMLGAVSAIPPGLGVVEGGKIPYQPWALAKRDENRKNWPSLDPEVKCYLPGVPRVTYLPYPFQILQYKDKILFVYQYSYARREIHMTKHEEAPIDQWLGWSNGHWEGDTLVIDVTSFIEPPTLALYCDRQCPGEKSNVYRKSHLVTIPLLLQPTRGFLGLGSVS